MRRICIFFFLLLLTLGVTTSVSAQSEIVGEQMKEFKGNVWINTDGTIKVEERILYDFGNEPHHGIIRTIPTIKKNTEGKKYRLDFNVENVIDENGTNYTYNDSRQGDNLNIKIGDANRTITGAHTYIITYTVRGALTYFSDHDELYWNITGNEWAVPIAKSSSTIHLPQSIPSEKIKVTCYSGFVGSTTQNCTTLIQGSTVTIESKSLLSNGEGITAVVGFPTGIVSIVESVEVKDFFTTIWGRIVLVLVLIVSLFWYLLLPLWLPIKWWISGRDPRDSSGPVQAWFDPPKTKSGRALTPAETGTLIDEHASIGEISSLIINLAQRGYLKIVEKGKDDFEFIKTKDSHNEELQDFEKTLLSDLFAEKETIRLKDKNTKLATTVIKVQNMLYEDLVKEGFFPENPDKIRSRYAVLSGVAAVTFNFFLLIMAAIFGRLMPRKTLSGVQATNVAKSLKNFLTSQERQLEFQAKNQIMFEKLLPFAIAFGVEKIWADRFKDITLIQPEWFVSNTIGVFNSQSFTRGLGASTKSFISAATPVSSSTGHSSGFSGGSSGGGGGGGGGGSW
ncbi:hypothetical protein BH09PAT2_BH09PAT2_03910 [soil metagenome]